MSTQKPPQISSEPGHAQRPPVQGTPDGQMFPQPPQFAGSVAVAMHAVPQSVRSAGHIVVVQAPRVQV